MDNLTYRIKENSLVARIAAKKLRAGSAAIVLGNTICLYNCSKEAFLENKKWLNHELCHIRQFREYGFFRFIFLYLAESIRKGYYHNKFEIEARLAEKNEVTGQI